jgi:hypothetical protein
MIQEDEQESTRDLSGELFRALSVLYLTQGYSKKVKRSKKVEQKTHLNIKFCLEICKNLVQEETKTDLEIKGNTKNIIYINFFITNQ